MLNSTTYLFSSFIDNPEFFFQGYCFIDNDYIYGLEGAKDFVNHSGKQISIGEDGCYVLARKFGGDYLFGSDNSGYKKILYYKDDDSGNWVVSNSLHLIISHLKEHAIDVTPDIAQMVAMAQTPTPTQQPITFNTIAKEIKILPLNTYLIIGRDKLIVSKYSRFDSNEKVKSYEELLSDFVETWSSRIATLLSNKDLVIEQALTGGVDSRAVFSLTELAKQGLSETILADHYLICGLTRGDTLDIVASQKISNHYGYSLNPERNNYKGRVRLTNMQRYEEWKDICLGTYAPIYFPSLQISPLHTSIGGGGGENHRPFYASYLNSTKYQSLIESICKGIKDPALKEDVSKSLYNVFSELASIDDVDEEDLLISHYKNFRNRFHIGLFPQYRVTFTPLSSNLLDKLANAGNMDKIRSSQLLYDLMNAVEGLIDFPFDKVDKKPTLEQLANLVSFSNSLNIRAGKCYIEYDKQLDVSKELDPSITPLVLLKQDFDLACQKEIVKSVWNEQFIQEAKDTIEDAVSKGRLSYAAGGRSVSAIIATGMFR